MPATAMATMFWQPLGMRVWPPAPRPRRANRYRQRGFNGTDSRIVPVIADSRRAWSSKISVETTIETGPVIADEATDCSIADHRHFFDPRRRIRMCRCYEECPRSLTHHLSGRHHCHSDVGDEVALVTRSQRQCVCQPKIVGRSWMFNGSERLSVPSKSAVEKCTSSSTYIMSWKALPITQGSFS